MGEAEAARQLGNREVVGKIGEEEGWRKDRFVIQKII